MHADAYSVLRPELLARLLPVVAAFLSCCSATYLSGRFLLTRVRRRSRIPIHVNDRGTSELEFALAFPFFLLMVLTTVQMALLVNATLIVDYAAFCAARSAAVWLPQSLPEEGPNAVDDDKGRSEKWGHIQRAASFACLPIAPRFTGVLSGLMGLGPRPELNGDAILQLARIGSDFNPVASIDYARFGVDLFDKWATSYFLTDVELLDGNGEAQRQFPSDQPITARVTHKFYMNVPGVGPLLGAALGQQYLYFFGPYYVPITASYSLMVSQG